ncbi:MAG: secretin N-terminal domain-containing protein, partial [Pseudomonadota bacterium]
FPVQNTTPSSLLAITSAFSSDEVEASADDGRRVIILSGPPSQIEDFTNTLRRFDLPQLANRVFGLLDVRYASVEEIAQELDPLLQETLGSAYGVVSIIPLPRLNQVFVATANNDQFNQIQTWVDRLDREALGDEPQLYYYVAQNAPATELAAQVDAIYSGIRAPLLGRESPARPTDPQLARTRDFAAASTTRLATPIFSNNQNFSIVPDELNNALIIRATGTEYREILTLLRRMDVLPKQVLIEVTIAEVTLNKDLQFGVRWFFSEGDFSGFFPDPVGVTDGVANLPSVSPSLSATYIDGLSIGAALNVLETVTDISVISTPSILVQNNQIASLQVGDQIPIVSQESQSVNAGDSPLIRNVQQRDTGVILQVEPRISGTNSVVLDIDQEVSDSIPTTTSNIDSPTIRQRQFSSTVAVESGATIVLGGLISDTDNGSRTSIPLLGDIPLIGPIFRQTSDATFRTELVVFLTPRIIDSSEDHEATIQYFQQRLENVFLLIEENESR